MTNLYRKYRTTKIFFCEFTMKSFCILAVVACCLVGAFALSDCEEHRERELKSNTKVKLVPKCASNGDYEALQCFQGSPFCMCWRPDGSHITDPSKHIKTCPRLDWLVTSSLPATKTEPTPASNATVPPDTAGVLMRTETRFPIQQEEVSNTIIKLILGLS
ncbi:UNVERIFIED_CONTAM: U24-ctenitoxin-Pn1a [Trichonephila clavipes]